MTRSKTGSTLGAKADMTEPTTQAGRVDALLAAIQPANYTGTDQYNWRERVRPAVETTLAEADATIAVLREAALEYVTDAGHGSFCPARKPSSECTCGLNGLLRALAVTEP